MAYESTTVPVSKSQGEVRDLLYRYGATNFAFAESVEGDRWWVAVEFVIGDERVRIRVPLVPPDPATIAAKARRARARTRPELEAEAVDQEARRIWRVVFHTLKARLVSVENGVESFAEAFLAHMVDPVTGFTMWDAVGPAVAAGALRSNGPGLMRVPMRELASYVDEHSDDGDPVDAEVVE